MKNNPEVKVLTDRVIELTYDTFDADSAMEYWNRLDPLKKMGGCSAVKVFVDGKVYVGRNYDFYCGDTPAFVVRNNGGKYRTIGVGSNPDAFEPWHENYTVREDILNAAPFVCCDVMSEAGLYAEVNIRPHEQGMEVVHTHEGKPRACTQCFLQLMLSNYATIDEIIAHLDDYDWFDVALMGFEEAFFVTDKNGRSVLFEFAANECRYTDSAFNANFFVNNGFFEKETLGCGQMRVERELAYVPFVRSEADVFTMMERGAYTQFYCADCDPAFAYPEFFELTGYNNLTAVSDREGCLAATRKQIEKLSKYTWEQKIAAHAWESTFTTAANVTDGYLHVHFSEHYKIDFTVSFD